MNTEELLDALLDKGAFFIVFTDARIEKVKDGQGVSISLTVIIEGKEQSMLRPSSVRQVFHREKERKGRQPFKEKVS